LFLQTAEQKFYFYIEKEVSIPENRI